MWLGIGRRVHHRIFYLALIIEFNMGDRALKWSSNSDWDMRPRIGHLLYTYVRTLVQTVPVPRLKQQRQQQPQQRQRQRQHQRQHHHLHVSLCSLKLHLVALFQTMTRWWAWDHSDSSGGLEYLTERLAAIW